MALSALRRCLIGLSALVGIALLAIAHIPAAHSQTATSAQLDRAYVESVIPLVKKYCVECHSHENAEAELNLEAFTSLKEIRQNTKAWVKVAEMLKTGDMPPKDAAQPTAEERQQIRDWLQRFLTEEAQAHAGDPGRVVLRRLNNAEYTYTLRDLTGVDSLTPAKEFPVDGAAGEGFTNTGNALVMSPSLVTKYLDAAKEVSKHMVLLPDGIVFSPSTTRRDWTNERLAAIREFYGRFTAETGGTHVNLQGVESETNRGGRLPLVEYLTATIAERDALKGGAKSIDAVAAERKLNAKYLGLLWKELTASEPSLVMSDLRDRWRKAQPADAPALAGEIQGWQNALFGFSTVGHIGSKDGPKRWLEPIKPLVSRKELRLKLPPEAKGVVSVSLVASTVGDGDANDYIVWERPRLVSPGRPDVLLTEVDTLWKELQSRRERLFVAAAKCLNAADEVAALNGQEDLAAIAGKHGIEPDVLSAWLLFLGIGSGGPVELGKHLPYKQVAVTGNPDVNGWGDVDALSVLVNKSNEDLRIPGFFKARSVTMHPSPSLNVIAGWRSPITAKVRIEGDVADAHVGCGNGIAWALELRRGATRQRLAEGVSEGDSVAKFGPWEDFPIRTGDVVSLVVAPRGGDHTCDCTAVNLKIVSTEADGRSWNLAGDLLEDVLAGNPHADRYGNADVWHLYSELEKGGSSGGAVLPAGSLLARWQTAQDATERKQLAEQVQALLLAGPPADKDSPDGQLYRQLTTVGGPLYWGALDSAKPNPSAPPTDHLYGLSPDVCGKRADGSTIDAASLSVRAPSVVTVELPAEILDGCELVVTAIADTAAGPDTTAQAELVLGKPAAAPPLRPSLPILVGDASPSRARLERSFDAFRWLFPTALCYTKIVPVDEVVTLALFYREDDHLCRLMLDDQQVAELDRLWDELRYISQDAILLVDVLAQLIEYATQDRPDMVVRLEPVQGEFADRAASFRRRLTLTEPIHLQAVLDFAARAFRRPLAATEASELRALYAKLRDEELPHEEALRLTLARVLVSPDFLYRIEKPGPGDQATPVTNLELATRLSYFLWSSAPDAELLNVAASGRLHEPAVLLEQTHRMLADAKTRRLATEFACQWLHIYEFDQHDEKSEQTFPMFGALKPAMYEESIRFFTDLFASGGSVLDILNADYCFVNEELAKHYGVPGVSGAEWRKIENAKQFARGGILAQATTLSKQSGASRTSPILRGNWVSEVLLGEKLPRPPKDVPQLPDEDAANAQLTVRQLTEKHSSDARCAGCHKRIDAFGFSLEAYDAIGRYREKDAAGHALDTVATTLDGTKLAGIDGLKNYLLTTRKQDFVRQFCRKLLGYALGRAVQLSDEPLLAKMQANLQTNNYQITSAIEDVITSRQFLEIRGRDVASEE